MARQRSRHRSAARSAIDGKERIFAFRKLPRARSLRGRPASTPPTSPKLDARHGAPSDLRPPGDRRADRARADGAAPHAARGRRQPDAARRDRAPRGDRGGAAPGAEDGGGRPAHRRHRARLQQSAHRDHRQSRPRAAPARRRRTRVARLARQLRARPPSAPPRWCSACSPSRASSRSRSKSVDINRLVQGMSELLRRTLGETVTIETVLAGGLWKAAVDPNQLENAIAQPRRQRARRDAGRRAAHHRDRQLPSRRALCRAGRRRGRARPIRDGGGERYRHRHDAAR